jgi:starch synthase
VTGGLADTIVDTTDETLAAGTANGFTFHEPSAHALSAVLKRAAAYFARPDAWQRLVANGLKEDWSWARSANQYAALYESTAARVRQGIPIATPA